MLVDLCQNQQAIFSAMFEHRTTPFQNLAEKHSKQSMSVTNKNHCDGLGPCQEDGQIPVASQLGSSMVSLSRTTLFQWFPGAA